MEYRQLGDGENFYFWEDAWCRERPLAENFHRVYSLSKLQNLTVKEVKNRWKHLEDPIWTRQLREWELEEVLEIFSIVKQTTKGKKKDVIRWSARHQV